MALHWAGDRNTTSSTRQASRIGVTFSSQTIAKVSRMLDALVMTNLIDPTLVDYVTAHSGQPDQTLLDLAAETMANTGSAAGMQISADQGALLTMLVQLTGAHRAVEV